jgi:hypothetical protein
MAILMGFITGKKWKGDTSRMLKKEAPQVDSLSGSSSRNVL